MTDISSIRKYFTIYWIKSKNKILIIRPILCLKLTVKFSSRYVLHKMQEFKKDVLELEIALEKSLQNDNDRFHMEDRETNYAMHRRPNNFILTQDHKLMVKLKNYNGAGA